LVIDFNVLTLILPLGELLLMELLLELRLHQTHFLLLRATLVDELFGSAGWTGEHSMLQK
jgi:hypothetical protein